MRMTSLVVTGVQITNYSFNGFHVMYYRDSNRLCKSRLSTPLPTPATPYLKPYSSVDNFKIFIKFNPNNTGLDVVVPFCDDTKKIILVAPENKFIRPDQYIMTNRGQGRKGGPDISRVFPGYYPNITGCHRNTLFSDEGGE